MLGIKHQIPLLFFFLFTSTLIAKPVTNDRKILYIDEQIRFADSLVSRGHYELAIEEYKRLIKKFADDPLAAEAWVQLAEAYAQKKDYKSAIDTFENFFKKFPGVKTVSAAKLKFALILYKTKGPASIKKAFQILAFLKSDSGSPEVIQDAASFYLSKFYFADNQQDKALKELELLSGKKIEKSPEHNFRLSAVLDLAEYFSSVGKKSEALKLLNSVSDKKGLSSSLKVRMQWSLGDLYYDMKKYGDAAEIFAKFAIIFPENPNVKNALYKRLQCLYMMNDYSKVITETDRIFKDGRINGKGWERFYCIKASALSAMKFYKRAFASLDKVLKESKDPNMIGFAAYKYIEGQIRNKDIKGAVNTAGKYIIQKHLPKQVIKDIASLVSANSGPVESEKILKTAIAGFKVNSENASVLKLNLGEVLIKNGKNKEALGVYRELNENCRKELKPYALMGEAQALENLIKRKEAAEKYKMIIKKYPKSALYPEAMLKIAVLLLADRKDWETAKIYFNELIKRFPKSPTSKLAAFYQANLAFYDKDYEKAKKILRKIIDSKDITPGLKIDIDQYLLWSLIKLKDTDGVILLFKSINKQEQFLAGCQYLFVNELGKFLLNKQPQLAIKCFEDLVKRKNKGAMQLGYLGSANIDMMNGNTDKALKKLKKAVDLDHDPKVTSEALIKLGSLLAEIGKPDEAVLILEKCIENAVERNTYHKVYLELAKILSRQPERLKAANRYAMKVYTLTNDKKMKMQAMLLSIEILLKQKNPTAAENVWKEFKETFPEMLDSERAKKIKKLLDAPTHK